MPSLLLLLLWGRGLLLCCWGEEESRWWCHLSILLLLLVRLLCACTCRGEHMQANAFFDWGNNSTRLRQASNHNCLTLPGDNLHACMH
jgi:hypothetical protein